MKKYKFQSKASLENFIEGLDQNKYKLLENNEVEIIASLPNEDDTDKEREMRWAIEDLSYEVKYALAQMNYLYGALENHYDGHLPPIVGAGKLEKALKALGMDDDYEVKKRAIFANKRGDFEVDLSLLKNDEEK